MKFTGLTIKEKSIFRSSNKKSEFEGNITFDFEQCGWIYLKIDDEICRKMIELVAPLFEQATNEKIEIIRQEIKKD